MWFYFCCADRPALFPTNLSLTPLPLNPNFACVHIVWCPTKNAELCEKAGQSDKHNVRVIELIISATKRSPEVFSLMQRYRQEWTWIDVWLQQYVRQESDVLTRIGSVMATSSGRKRRHAELLKTVLDLRGCVEAMGGSFANLPPRQAAPVMQQRPPAPANAPDSGGNPRFNSSVEGID